MKTSRIAIAIVALAFVASVPAMAALEAGQKELTASFGYSKQEFDDSDVEVTDSNLDVDFGYLLTDNHEVGARLSWFKAETDPGGFDIDGTAIGAFYHFNFGTEGSMTPFVGPFYTFVGGDAGDTVDSAYGAEGGLKIYPWENGGFIVKLVWSQFTGADSFPDGDGIDINAGISLRW
jgi:hypothetical protein